MKKYLLILVVSTFLKACSSEEAYVASGKIDLALGESKELIEASRISSLIDMSDYNISIDYKNTNLWKGKYRLFQDIEFSYPVGDSYRIYAESCTLNEAQSSNDGWGQLRTAGQSDIFSVIANQTTDVTFVCDVQNAKLSVSYDPTFVTAFTEYSVLVYKTSDDGRRITFPSDATFDTHAAYFNIEALEEVKYEVTCKYNGVSKKYMGLLPIFKAKWYRLSIKLSTPSTRNAMINVMPLIQVDIID